MEGLAVVMKYIFGGLVTLVVSLLLFFNGRIWSRHKEITDKMHETDTRIVKLEVESIKRSDLTGAINRTEDGFQAALDKMEGRQKERDEASKGLINNKIDNVDNKIDNVSSEIHNLIELLRGQ